MPPKPCYDRAMIVSHARRFIFFHNPKCAGMSFRDILKPYHDDAFSFWGIYTAPYFRNQIDHSHLRLWELHAQFPRIFECAQSYNTVIFVRNPYERFLAALNEHFKKFQEQIDLAAMTPEQRASVVEQFMQKLLHISRITTDWRFVHFSPQTWFLRVGNTTVPRHVIPMDNGGAFARSALAELGLPIVETPWTNRSPVDLSAVLRSPSVRNFVEQFYADDFAFFRANPALARLAGAAGQ